MVSCFQSKATVGLVIPAYGKVIVRIVKKLRKMLKWLELAVLRKIGKVIQRLNHFRLK